MANISSFTGTGWIVASTSLPLGGPVIDFSDDQDSVNVEEIEVTGVGYNPNGQQVVWTKPTGYKLTISVIPKSLTDILLQGILNANTATEGKLPAFDVITFVMNYPNTVPSTFSNGVIKSGIPSYSSTNEGRIKTKTYAFEFQNYVGV